MTEITTSSGWIHHISPSSYYTYLKNQVRSVSWTLFFFMWFLICSFLPSQASNLFGTCSIRSWTNQNLSTSISRFTLLKFNSLPLKSYLPNRKLVFQPLFFRSEVLNFQAWVINRILTTNVRWLTLVLDDSPPTKVLFFSLGRLWREDQGKKKIYVVFSSKKDWC